MPFPLIVESCRSEYPISHMSTCLEGKSESRSQLACAHKSLDLISYPETECRRLPGTNRPTRLTGTLSHSIKGYSASFWSEVHAARTCPYDALKG